MSYEKDERAAIQAESAGAFDPPPFPTDVHGFRRYVAAKLRDQGTHIPRDPDAGETQLQKDRRARDRAYRRRSDEGWSPSSPIRLEDVRSARLEASADDRESLEALHLKAADKTGSVNQRSQFEVGPGPSGYERQQPNPCSVGTRKHYTGDRRSPEWRPATNFEHAPVRRAVYGLRQALSTPVDGLGALGEDGIRGAAPISSPYVAKCGRVRVSHNVGVVANGRGRCSYRGLCTCGSVHACPVCAMKIKASRADEVRAVVEWHGRADAALLTLTIRHAMGDDLKKLRSLLARAWTATTNGNPWKRFGRAVGLEGSIRALEVTHGPNGFHPHIHAVLLLRGDWQNATVRLRRDTWRGVYEREFRTYLEHHPGDDAAAAELADTIAQWTVEHAGDEVNALEWLRMRWFAMVARYLGLEHAPDDTHGVVIHPCSSCDYISKIGLEISDPGRKTGRGENRTPLEVATDFAAELGRLGGRLPSGALRRDAAIWRMYTHGMKGARQLTWSQGLKARAGIVDRSDAEIAEHEDKDDQTTTHVMTLPAATWDGDKETRGIRALWVSEPGSGVVKASSAGHGVAAAYWLLEQIEKGGTNAARSALNKLRRIGRRVIRGPS